MKKLISMILLLMLAALMICALCSCTAPVIANPDGSDTVVGAAIKTGLDVIEAAAVTALGIFGAWWASKAKDKESLQNINTAMNNMLTVVKQTVGELKQTVVEGMKETNEDGKLTPAQVDYLKGQLLSMTLNKLDNPTKSILQAAGADLCALISGAAESWISEQKDMSNAVLLGGVVSDSSVGSVGSAADQPGVLTPGE